MSGITVCNRLARLVADHKSCDGSGLKTETFRSCERILAFMKEHFPEKDGVRTKLILEESSGDRLVLVADFLSWAGSRSSVQVWVMPSLISGFKVDTAGGGRILPDLYRGFLETPYIDRADPSDGPPVTHFIVKGESVL